MQPEIVGYSYLRKHRVYVTRESSILSDLALPTVVIRLVRNANVSTSQLFAYLAETVDQCRQSGVSGRRDPLSQFVYSSPTQRWEALLRPDATTREQILSAFALCGSGWSVEPQYLLAIEKRELPQGLLGIADSAPPELQEEVFSQVVFSDRGALAGVGSLLEVQLLLNAEGAVRTQPTRQLVTARYWDRGGERWPYLAELECLDGIVESFKAPQAVQTLEDITWTAKSHQLATALRRLVAQGASFGGVGPHKS